MKKDGRVFRKFLLGLVAAAPCIALAGPIEFKQPKPEVRAVPIDTLRVDVEQTFQSDFKGGHGFDPHENSNNNTNTWHEEIEYNHRIPLRDGWYLRVGLYASRYDFGNNRS